MWQMVVVFLLRYWTVCEIGTSCVVTVREVSMVIVVSSLFIWVENIIERTDVIFQRR